MVKYLCIYIVDIFVFLFHLAAKGTTETASLSCTVAAVLLELSHRSSQRLGGMLAGISYRQ